jgi:hypothetical protein
MNFVFSVLDSGFRITLGEPTLADNRGKETKLFLGAKKHKVPSGV